MTNTELKELDRKVAEAQGWVLDSFETGRFWCDKSGAVVDVDEYHPTTSNFYAMELLIKYKINLRYIEYNKEWVAYTEQLISFIRGIKTTRSHCKTTPMIAICKAVIAYTRKG